MNRERDQEAETIRHLMALAWVLLIVMGLLYGGLVLAVATAWIWAAVERFKAGGRRDRVIDRWRVWSRPRWRWLWRTRDGIPRWWLATVIVMHTLAYTDDGVRPFMRWWDRDNFLVRLVRWQNARSRAKRQQQ